MNKISRTVKSFDMYGDYFSLRINNENKFKSIAGGLLSIVTIFIMIFCFISFGKDFYMRKNPKVNKEVGFFNDSSIPSLNGTEYPNKTMVFFYSKNYDTLLKPQIIYIKNDTISISYLSQCSKYFIPNFSNFLPSKDLNDNVFYCFHLNDYVLASAKANEFWLSLVSCNSISNSDIKPDNNLSNCIKSNSTISYLTLTFLTEKLGFSPDKENPFIKKYDTTQIILSNSVNTQLKLSLSVNELNNNIGLITDEIEKTTELSMTFSSSIQNLVTQSKYPLMKLSVFISDDYTIYFRSYSQLQDLLASVGGFMKLIMTILNLFNLMIRTYLIDWYIIDNYLNTHISSFLKNKTKSNTDINSLIHNNSSCQKSNIFLKI
jgi:uncharacterized small protein (DUF1192 family)